MTSRWINALLFAGLAVPAGCGSNEESATPSKLDKPKLAISPATPSSGQKQPAKLDPRLHQSFLKATLQVPPGDQLRPPDVTKAGKSVGMIYQQIVGDKGKGGLWEQIKYRSPSGNKLQYSATIKTTAGDLAMELWPAVAPNHVRNFVALSRAGYYNGLSFDRAVEETVPISPGDFVRYIEAGCPKGTGEVGYGSIGYWMKPEIDDNVHHEMGAVGASHEAELETAACKFYINLEETKWLDGQFTIFGKIVDGMEVARQIFNQPKMEGFDGRLADPVVIERIIIHTKEVDR